RGIRCRARRTLVRAAGCRGTQAGTAQGIRTDREEAVGRRGSEIVEAGEIAGGRGRDCGEEVESDAPGRGAQEAGSIELTVPAAPDSRPLPRSFYRREAELVARTLLGQVLVSTIDGALAAGRIVETEAYIGPHDAASHAAERIGRTRRNESMFG